MGIETARGPRIVVPYLQYKGILVRRPVLGGVFVVAPGGAIEDLEPAEAARRPELAESGRVFPDSQARRLHDAYRYEGGLLNAWFVHENQTNITDTEVNRQPYLIDFEGSLGLQWVTVAEPYGRAFAASAIFLTDAVTGRTRIYRVPRRTSLSGNRRAIQAVRAVSIPGIDFGNERGGSGNFQVVEPRPVFVKGRLVYLTSIIPNTANAVSKTVVVDAETNKLVAIFDNDRDPQAEEKTRRYIATGEVPEEATLGGADGDAAAQDGAEPTPTPTPTPAPVRSVAHPRAMSGAGSTTRSAASASCCASSRICATRSAPRRDHASGALSCSRRNAPATSRAAPAMPTGWVANPCTPSSKIRRSVRWPAARQRASMNSVSSSSGSSVPTVNSAGGRSCRRA